jgi:hypothetical protein
VAKSVETKNPKIALRRGELSRMSWDDAYFALIDDLTADQAMRVLRVMSDSRKLYRHLTSFVENSLDDDA